MAQFVLSISIVNFEHVIADCALNTLNLHFRPTVFLTLAIIDLMIMKNVNLESTMRPKYF